jgi:hypothetical protein
MFFFEQQQARGNPDDCRLAHKIFGAKSFMHLRGSNTACSWKLATIMIAASWRPIQTSTQVAMYSQYVNGMKNDGGIQFGPGDTGYGNPSSVQSHVQAVGS